MNLRLVAADEVDFLRYVPRILAIKLLSHTLAVQYTPHYICSMT